MLNITTCVIPITFASFEYAEALTIRRQVFVQEQGVDEKIEVDDFEESAQHFLLKKNDHSVGAARLRLKGDLVKLERIAVIQNARGLGFGRLLTEALLDYAHSHYPRHLPYLHAQASAVVFYEKLKWVAVGKTFFEAQIEHQKFVYPPRDWKKVQQLLISQNMEADPEIKAALQLPAAI